MADPRQKIAIVQSKKDVLSEMNFGHRIAEDEGDDLHAYFVETDQWNRIFRGDVDVVYGAKGSGKSAIYSLLLKHAAELRRRGVNVVPAENPRGTPVFANLVEDPPTTEQEFRGLWKLYFLCLIANNLRKSRVSSGPGLAVVQSVEQAGLLPADSSLRGMLRLALDYVRNLLKAESIEGGIKLDPTTGMPAGVTGKITLREPGTSQRAKGVNSADTLLKLANDALTESGQEIWLLLDRLDVAFAESHELESNALRAVFRVYLDLMAFERIALKIFLRTDIWRRITSEGFREASHITRHITLSWESSSLLNLVIRRAIHNEGIRRLYSVDPQEVLRSTANQEALFYKMFPRQVDAGSRKPSTFDWMLSRTCDGSKQTAPRELIHLLSCARDVQLKKLEIGQPEPPNGALFDRTALKEALPEVSKVRYEQTLCAEYPDLRDQLEKLKAEKTQQTAKTLAKIWGVDKERALSAAERLTEVGFFEKRTIASEPIFWVPFLYRDSLEMIQGPAE